MRSLYLRNLPDKLPKEDLKRNLYMLFATYGVILDIMAFKTMKMRGQAHIVFRDLDAATQAMRALQSFTFFGKDMVCARPTVVVTSHLADPLCSKLPTPVQNPTLSQN